jgi:hypothetical protein
MSFWCGSGSGSGSCFLSSADKMPTKNFVFSKYFCLLLFEGTFTSISLQRQKVQKKSQNSRNQGYTYFLCLLMKGSGYVQIMTGSGSGRPKNILILRIPIHNNASIAFLSPTYTSRISKIPLPLPLLRNEWLFFSLCTAMYSAVKNTHRSR